MRHEALRKVIDRAAPEIDTTKILSEEEQAELQRQWDEQKAARKLAEQTSREALRAQLRRTVERVAGDDAPVVD
jgi:hypothetical protein